MSHLAAVTRPKRGLAKPSKTKKARPPIKVVYISNPMRVKTSASRFRALVQELTGRDSEIPGDPTAYEVEDDVIGTERVGVPVGDEDDDVSAADRVSVPVGDEDDDVSGTDRVSVRVGDVDGGSKSVEGSATTTTTNTANTTSSCEEMSYGDEFLMMEDFPNLGSEGLLWTFEASWSRE